jgi:hypothetical protein
VPNYKNPAHFHVNQSPQFDALNGPSTAAPTSGIYRCAGCGHEATSTKGHPLPPQDHHTHTVAEGKIRWQLVAACLHVKS